ncbi:MHC class II regulatory factor RFX1a isoform X4 [Onychostoma macrolepis]|uniref:MHC class II regulatory factor RFX1a isoform X4 n=1 Tax=Onychostoma macrolepis TaxID=369639 RepID=UPI00272C2A50|nr:MHC class II regulatory factor RFX1a isoform X4 [Onychostoma macrolepis]
MFARPRVDSFVSPMATPAYVRELQQTSQPQGGGVTPTSGQAATVTAAPQQFLAELQTTGATPSAAPPTGQTTPPPSQAQKSQAPPAQAPPTQTQYVTAEIQSSPTQSSSQNTPQYIVVTVTEGSLHSSDSVSDSSPPAAVVQTGVPTQVVQQVQTAQQRSVVQATSQTTKTEPGTQLNVTSLQSVHLTQENSFLRQRGSVAQRESEVKRQRQIENWLERRPAVVLLEKSTNPFGDSLSYASVNGGLLDCSSCFPPSLPVAYSPVTFSLPVMSVGWETDRVSYTSAPVPDVQSYLYEMPSAHSVQQQLQQVPVQHVYTNQVQYVEGGDANYTTSTIRSSSFPYTETPLYTQTTAGQYYETTPASGSEATSPGTPLTVSVTTGSPGVSMFVAGTGQIVANPTTAAGGGVTAVVAATGTASNGSGDSGGEANGSSGSYVIQGGYMLASSGTGSSGNGHGYPHPTRASPATLSSGPQVQWLLDNYETAEGVSLPRSTLYCHYLLHCQEQKLEPVNAASFGKLIRSVFMGLRTRRLGTRGNSKYHYYGLRIKASSSLLRLMEDQQHLAMRQQPFSQKQRLKPVQKVEGITNGMSSGSGQQQQQQQSSGLSDISTQVQQYQQFLDASRALPEFPDVDLQGRALPEGIELEHLKSFQLLYREHCEAILDVMVNLQFPLVETLWKTFWRFSESQAGDSATLAVHDESEKRLPKSCLVLLCKYDPVLRWSRDCDNTLYQGLVEMLIPDVLRPIPSALTQAIRNFAKSLESWLTNAMMNIPEEMVRVKVTSASAFAQTLRRYTSLNHLAQAARAVLQNTAQINQMLSDLNRVDFANVQEQASWVCRCEDRVVQRLEQDFKLTLQQQNSLEQWAAWLDGVVSQVLKPYQSSSAFPKAAKLFLLKWSFYSSMVIRDLTLRSAASFGSFHLIRLLYDEYMYYLIEHRVAQAKGETPIAVMGEFASLGRSLNPLDPDKEEEEEEEEDSDYECQELSLQSDGGAIGDESLEPPAKLARTDQRVLFTTGSMDN